MNDSAPTKPQRITRRRLLYAIIALFIAGAATLLLLPTVIRESIEHILRSQGHEHAQVDNVDFNLFTGTLTVHGLKGGEEVDAFLDAGHVYLNLDWMALLHRNVLIKTIVVEDVALHVRQDESGQWHIGKIAIAPSAEAKPESEPFELPLGMGADAVTFRNVRLVFDQELIHADLVVEQGTIDDLRTWTADNPAPFEVEMTINGAPVRFSGHTTPFDETAYLDIAVTLDEFSLDSLQALAADAGVQDLAGTVDAEINAEVTLQFTDQSMDAKVEGEFALQAIAAAYDSYRIETESIGWNGSINVNGTFDAPAIQTEGTVMVAQIDLAEREQDLSVKASNLVWNGTADIDSGSPFTLATSGELSGDHLSLKGPPNTVDQATLETTGFSATGLTVTSAETIRIAATEIHGTIGGLSATGLAGDTGQVVLASAELEGSAFNADLGDQSLMTADTVTGRVAGLLATELSPELPEAALDKGEVILREFRLEALNKATDLGANAEFSLSAIRMAETSIPAEGNVGAINGAVSLAVGLNQNGAIDINAKGSTGSSSITIHNPDSGLDILHVDRADLEGLEIAGIENIRLASTKVHKPRLLQRPGLAREAEDAYIATLDILAVDGIALSKYHAEAEAIHLDGLTAHLLVTEAGDPELQALLQPFGSAGDTTPAKPEASPSSPMEQSIQEPEFTVKADLVEFLGNTKVHLEDRSVTPVARLDITDLAASVRDLDSETPDRLVPITLEATMGGTAQLRLSGDASLLAVQPSVNAKAQLQALSLPELTGYTQRTIGYRIDSGTFGFASDIKIDHAQLQTQNTLFMSQLLLSKLDETELSEFDNQLGMPVNAAVNLLRDGDGSIELTIPVEGDLDSPEFKIGQVVRKALGNAMKKSVLTVLAPLRILGVGKDDAPLNEAMAFKAVPFESGSHTIEAGAEEYLDDVAKILKKHPGLTLRLTGMAGPSDLAVDVTTEQDKPVELAEGSAPPPLVPAGQAEKYLPPEALLKRLADDRAKHVNAYLVDTAGVDPAQLVIGESTVDTGDDESRPPGVQIGL